MDETLLEPPELAQPVWCGDRFRAMQATHPSELGKNISHHRPSKKLFFQKSERLGCSPSTLSVHGEGPQPAGPWPHSGHSSEVLERELISLSGRILLPKWHQQEKIPEWFGSERTFKTIQFQLPALDNFHYPRSMSHPTWPWTIPRIQRQPQLL